MAYQNGKSSPSRIGGGQSQLCWMFSASFGNGHDSILQATGDYAEQTTYREGQADEGARSKYEETYCYEQADEAEQDKKGLHFNLLVLMTPEMNHAARRRRDAQAPSRGRGVGGVKSPDEDGCE